MLGIKNSEMARGGLYCEAKNLKGTARFEMSNFPFTSNNMGFVKSPRFIESKDQKKCISPRRNRDKSKHYSQPKNSKGCNSKGRKGDKRYFDKFKKHNESANYYESKRGPGRSGVNISIQEVDAKKNKMAMKKPHCGTGNMSHILALLNKKK